LGENSIFWNAMWHMADPQNKVLPPYLKFLTKVATYLIPRVLYLLDLFVNGWSI